MDDLVKEVIPLLQYLIPGFLTAWIFYSLTAFKRPDTFGQIVQALVFTFLIQGAVSCLESLFLFVGAKGFVLGLWDIKAQAAWSAVLAGVFGLISCFIANSDKLHNKLRESNFTVQSSFPSEWFSAFKRRPRFVVLHLNDERRLYGWPLEWPSSPSQGQFVIQDPSWLDDDGNENPLGAELLVIDSSKVQWVEFTKKEWE